MWLLLPLLDTCQGGITNRTLTYLRVQKTGSKTMVYLLEEGRDWSMRCASTGWIGQSTSTCREGIARTLRRGAAYPPQPKNIASRSFHRERRICLIDGHCAMDTLTMPVSRYSSSRSRSPSRPGQTLVAARPSETLVAASMRHFIVTILREPVARTLSE